MRFWLILAALAAPLLVAARDMTDTAIRAVLEKQVADWNHGEIHSFVLSYAEKCTFVGKTVVEGRAAVEERYKRNYASAAAMGHLTFSELKIKRIEAKIAIVTGAFHLQRSTAGGGDASGIFSLVFERQAGIWRIVLDHTS